MPAALRSADLIPMNPHHGQRAKYLLQRLDFIRAVPTGDAENGLVITLHGRV